jgi:hypothetical protein
LFDAAKGSADECLEAMVFRDGIADNETSFC